MRAKPKLGEGVVIGKNLDFGKDVVVWNYVVIGDGTRIGDKTRIGSFCDVGRNVKIGRSCNIQAHVTISNECSLGDNVFIGPNSSLLNDKFPCSDYITAPIICDNAVIGGCVTVLPNVTVGRNAVVAAGSVVTKDVQSGIMVLGAPARKVMTRKEYETKKKAFVAGRR